MGGDATKTSFLTPAWMQTGFEKNKTDAMKGIMPVTVNLRQENNRMFLCEKDQPQKSVWSFGDFRHNVHSKELAKEYAHQTTSNKVVRMMEWKEQPTAQGFDKPVAAKIGSYHQQMN